jgi:hypothetical protein
MDEEPDDPVTVERQILVLAVGMLWMAGTFRTSHPIVTQTAAYLARRAGMAEFARFLNPSEDAG